MDSCLRIASTAVLHCYVTGKDVPWGGAQVTEARVAADSMNDRSRAER